MITVIIINIIIQGNTGDTWYTSDIGDTGSHWGPKRYMGYRGHKGI